MKRFLFWFGFVLILFSSCSSEVNFLADYEEIPIIYGVLDAKADTNFIKITRAFYANSDAQVVALNPDSSNYPGKLNARLVEYQNGDSVREIILDTIIIHNKQQGVFYGCDQKLYYTTERLNVCDKFNSYQYELIVDFPDQTIKSKADIVGNNSFRIETGAINFSKDYFGTRRPVLFAPALNASLYDFTISFTFLEQRTPDGDSVPRTMQWSLGYMTDYELSQNMDGNFSYSIVAQNVSMKWFVILWVAIRPLQDYIVISPIIPLRSLWLLLVRICIVTYTLMAFQMLLFRQAITSSLSLTMPTVYFRQEWSSKGR